MKTGPEGVDAITAYIPASALATGISAARDAQ